MAEGQLTLIAQTYTADSIGQQVPTESRTYCWAEISSATRGEVFQGGRNGLNPELVAVTPYVNYNGETICEYGGSKYSIYRTYIRDEDIELYLEKRTGNG